MRYGHAPASVASLATLVLAGCGHIGTAGILMDDSAGPGFSCEGVLGSWSNEGLEIKAHPSSAEEAYSVLGSVLGLTEVHPEAGFADTLGFEMTAAGLVVTPVQAGEALGAIVIPTEQVRCEDGRIELDRSRWHGEAFAGTAIQESGTFTLVTGSGGSLVLRYSSSRKGLLLYGIPVWVSDEDLYRFPPHEYGSAASTAPRDARPGSWPPGDLAALGIYGLPRANVLRVDGTPVAQGIWKRTGANAALLTPGPHEVEVEVMGDVEFWSLKAPPRRVVLVQREFLGGHTYVVFGKLIDGEEPWVDIFDAGPDVPAGCLPELAIPPSTEACLAARGIAYPRPPAAEDGQ